MMEMAQPSPVTPMFKSCHQKVIITTPDASSDAVSVQSLRASTQGAERLSRGGISCRHWVVQKQYKGLMHKA